MIGRFGKLEASQADPAAESLAAPTAGEPVRDATFYFDEATRAMCDGLHESALRLFTRCLKEDRARIPAWVGQLQMLLELREDLEARLWAGKALELFKGNGEILACQSQAHLRAGDRPAARAASDLAISAPGSSPLRWIARGEALLHDRPAIAAECFVRAAAEPGADWFVPVRIARVYLRHRRPAPASEHAQNATRAAPQKPFTWLTLAECHEQLGSMSDAAHCLRTAAQLAHARRDILEHVRECERRSDSRFPTLRRFLGR